MFLSVENRFPPARCLTSWIRRTRLLAGNTLLASAGARPTKGSGAERSYVKYDSFKFRVFILDPPLVPRVGRTGEPFARAGRTAGAPTLADAPTEASVDRSIHMLPAVDRERRARDEAALVGHQEQHPAGDLLGLAEAADGDAGDDLLQHFLGHGAHHLGVDIAGGDGVDGDALAGALLGQGLGEAVDARLGGGVVHLAVLPGLAVDGADVDDAAEAALAHAVDDAAGHVEAGGQVGVDDLGPLLRRHLV